MSMIDLNKLPPEVREMVVEELQQREASLEEKCKKLKGEFQDRCKKEGVTLGEVCFGGKKWSRKAKAEAVEQEAKEPN
jgi:TRAP-type C4-dicarboxylate transport system substrate-binding protein